MVLQLQQHQELLLTPEVQKEIKSSRWQMQFRLAEQSPDMHRRFAQLWDLQAQHQHIIQTKLANIRSSKIHQALQIFPASDQTVLFPPLERPSPPGANQVVVEVQESQQTPIKRVKSHPAGDFLNTPVLLMSTPLEQFFSSGSNHVTTAVQKTQHQQITKTATERAQSYAMEATLPTPIPEDDNGFVLSDFQAWSQKAPVPEPKSPLFGDDTDYGQLVEQELLSLTPNQY